MKKNVILGVIAILLTVAACYVAYYRFWAALVGFGISAVVLPIAFHNVTRRFAWLSVPFAAVLDLVLYWPDFSYYESRGLFVLAALVQLAVIAGVVLLLKFVDKREDTDAQRD
ncbi:MAG: hypothetical protein E7450_06905 [Ruminococcaceae bacterium]|nr:hypothetical protein [Oscillospiraceae bacterium]